MAKKIDYAALFTLRKDGRYQYAYNDHGSRRFLYCRDPEKLYHEVEALGQPTEPTFAEIAAAWHDFAWERLSDGTKGSYAAPYKRALAEMDGFDAKDIMPRMITGHLERLKRQGLGLKSVKTQRTIYSQIYKFAINDKRFEMFVRENPAQDAILPKGLASTKREAPEDDIVDKIRSNATTAYWGLFAMFLISTGCRRGEALAVTWGDIDFKSKSINIGKAVKYSGGKTKLGDPKTDAGNRPVLLLPDLQKLLVKPPDAKPGDYVFPAESGKAMPESTYRRHWTHYCKDQGFVICELEEKRKSKQGKEYIYRKYKNSLTAHVLRHGYATMLFEADVDVYTAQKLLGHADVRTTMAIYTHLRAKKQQSSLDKLTAFVNNGYTIDVKTDVKKSVNA